jgi:hypothetical protein
MDALFVQVPGIDFPVDDVFYAEVPVGGHPVVLETGEDKEVINHGLRREALLHVCMDHRSTVV